MTAAAKKAADPKATADSSDEPKRAEKVATYKVTAPLIAITLGSQVLQYSAGDTLPNGVDEDSIKRLTDLGLIAEG